MMDIFFNLKKVNIKVFFMKKNKVRDLNLKKNFIYIKYIFNILLNFGKIGFWFIVKIGIFGK